VVPTVAPPPAETPTTVAPPPAETPTAVTGLPTETATAGTSNVSGSTYTSPTFGYQISWDPTWSVVTDSSQNGFDVLRLSNGAVVTDLYSGASTMGLEQCVTSLVEYYQGNTSYSNIVLQNSERSADLIGECRHRDPDLRLHDEAGTGIDDRFGDLCGMPGKGRVADDGELIPMVTLLPAGCCVGVEAGLLVVGAPRGAAAGSFDGAATEARWFPPRRDPPPTKRRQWRRPCNEWIGDVLPVLDGGSTVSGFGQLTGKAARST